ncbi:MAG: alpha-hydroxy-acid oxidizing protein [Gemmatimonadota bacterium]|nr:alpha-hydroxy-acid oxidizing enzyme [Gemmatimonadota bacterium]HCD00958.1 alpha-hydroxy-acid oxidizing enzyme [Planctomycetaceae bacterium]MBV26084.1 alpha-hydroxy-acid oxidizing enzyme [Gemmatimonadota bacterium]MEC9242332.1 alpha-hydroxy-acid oxidizing protein [Gemmatimonadota bacterium]HAT17534.1 alpha-hydroxy-acid oxidizing enzyme [Gemmatimonadota bacterium]
MTQPESDTSLPDQRASRRKFFKFMAASPLAALAYAAWPSRLLEQVAAEVPSGPPMTPAPLPCVNCGAPVLPPGIDETRAVPAIPPRAARQQVPYPQEAQEEQLMGSLIAAPGDATNVWDFERVTHENNLAPHWDYLHMGVDDYETRVANREGFQRLMLRPRRLATEPARGFSTSTEILGQQFNSPLFLCPVAALQAYHTQGEAGAARAAQRRGLLQLQSHQSSQTYEEIAEARGEPHWFQIYTNPDMNVNQRVVDRVVSAGCRTLVWTIDLLGGSNRELSRRSLVGEGRDSELCQQCHQHQEGYVRAMNQNLGGPAGERPPYTWDWVNRLKDLSDMNLVVKGIVTAEEAELAIEHGADGIYVSNHGGRAVNSLWSTIDALPEVVAAVRGRVPVMIDSGVRRGGDVFKALALGADAVGIGRPYVWGLGAFGEDGVDEVIQVIMNEFRMVMRQTRTTSIDQITSRFVMEAENPIMTRLNEFGFGL